MASLEKRGNRYRIVFRYAGKKYQYRLKSEEEKDAGGCLARLEENLRLLERGRLTLPPAAHLPTFLISDGKVSERPQAPATLTLQRLREEYQKIHSTGTMEQNSLVTATIHLDHFVETFGARFAVQTLQHADLQRHIDRRARMPGIRERKLSPVTIQKEMSSFRACWNWAVAAGLLTGAFPNRGLRYPKTDEKPPFQTWAEIEQQITTGDRPLLSHSGAQQVGQAAGLARVPTQLRQQLRRQGRRCHRRGRLDGPSDGGDAAKIWGFIDW